MMESSPELMLPSPDPCHHDYAYPPPLAALLHEWRTLQLQLLLQSHNEQLQWRLLQGERAKATTGAEVRVGLQRECVDAMLNHTFPLPSVMHDLYYQLCCSAAYLANHAIPACSLQVKCGQTCNDSCSCPSNAPFCDGGKCKVGASVAPPPKHAGGASDPLQAAA